MRLLSYNIRYGGRGRERAIAEVIAASDPDVVLLQEATDPRAVERIANFAGLEAYGSRPGESLGFLARRPPCSVRWRSLPRARHAYLEVQPSGTRWRVVGVHLRAMHANWAERRRVLDALALVRALGELAGAPHVLAGDFNSLPPGDVLDLNRLPLRLRALVWVSGRRITWRAVQGILDEGYADAWMTAGARPPGLTFPAWEPHLRLDYAFTPETWKKFVEGCGPLLDPPVARTASDHLPLLLDLAEPDSGASR
jgi:exodeoxyribonuclease-3